MVTSTGSVVAGVSSMRKVMGCSWPAITKRGDLLDHNAAVSLLFAAGEQCMQRGLAQIGRQGFGHIMHLAIGDDNRSGIAFRWN